MGSRYERVVRNDVARLQHYSDVDAFMIDPLTNACYIRELVVSHENTVVNAVWHLSRVLHDSSSTQSHTKGSKSRRLNSHQATWSRSKSYMRYFAYRLAIHSIELQSLSISNRMEAEAIEILCPTLWCQHEGCGNLYQTRSICWVSKLYTSCFEMPA